MKSIFVISIFLVLSNISLPAQGVGNGEAEYLAEILALTDEDETQIIAESLQALAERPAIINSGDEEEIARLFFLSEFQVRVLADHVRQAGKIATIYEIALLPGFDRKTAMLIYPYVSFEDSATQSGKTGSVNSIMSTAVIKIPDRHKADSGVRALVRFRHNAARLSYGFTAENDPGEKFGFKGSAGTDFFSGHMMVSGKGFFERLIIGDYSLRFGEGLIFNNNAWLGSKLASPSYMAGRIIVAPYVSSEENNYFRGGVCVMGSLTGGMVLFVSSNKTDARISLNEVSGDYYVSNLVRGGLHNTQSGMEARNSLTETVAGLHLSAGIKNIRGGITASFTTFSYPFLPDTSRAEYLFSFRGQDLINIGVDFKAGTGRILFFTENAVSFPGSWAATAGIRATPSGRVTINILGRHFARDYYSFHSNTFRSGSATNNETGLAGNIHLEAARHLFLSAGIDVSRYPWLRYRSSAPSSGLRYEMRCEYIPDDNTYLRLSWISSESEYDLHNDTGMASLARQRREQLSGQFSFAPAAGIRLTTRTGYCSVTGEKENGWMLCQDITLSPETIPLKLYLRYALFTTGSYATRLYAWENDMLNSFNIPALFGDGSRIAFMVTWKPFHNLEIRGKYSVTAATNDMTGNTKQEVRVQGKVVF